MATVTAPMIPISVGILYPLGNFHQITGMGRKAMREARRRGLRVRYVGKRGYVRGEDFLQYVEQHGRDEQSRQPTDKRFQGKAGSADAGNVLAAG